MGLSAHAPDILLPDLGRRPVSRNSVVAALVIAVALAGITFLASSLQSVGIVTLVALVPICATVWGGAQALTAVLLWGQFYITGSIGFLCFAIAYGYAALISVPYIASIPGVAPAFGSPGDLQLRGELWTSWHLVFALLIVTGFLIDPLLTRRIVIRRDVTRCLFAAVSGTVVFTVLVSLFAWSIRDSIPVIVAGGHATALYRQLLAPLVAIVNLVACAIALVRGRAATSLSVWFSLALFAAAMDAILNADSRQLYTLPWYLAKVLASLMAAIVFAMLVVEIAALYRRLIDLAIRDPLTGLQNRRGLDEYLRRAFDHPRKGDFGLALMLVDIDHFKRYNDRYGHALGDVALCRVASVLRESSLRRNDLVARYGGEEFVVALFDVTEEEAETIAERMRRRVEREEIANDAVELGRMTISIGISRTSDASSSCLEDLFERADRALYEAKARGRNCFIFSGRFVDVQRA